MNKVYIPIIRLGLLALLIFALIIPIFIKAKASTEKSNDFNQISSSLNDAYKWKLNEIDAASINEAMSEYLPKMCDNGTVQTYVMAINMAKQNGCNNQINNQTFLNSILEYINVPNSSLNELSPTSIQKTLLTIDSCIRSNSNNNNNNNNDNNSNNSNNNSYKNDKVDTITPDIYNYVNQNVIEYASENTIGAKGIMSYIYGLKMLDICSINSKAYTREQVVISLLEMQLQDGGYALVGDHGDIDVTAMVLQALSPYYKNPSLLSENISKDLVASVDKSISFLADAQLSDGDYSSQTSPCSESTAQVIIALCDLGIDISSPEFTKEGSLIDGLLKYQNKDGGFSHILDSPSNDMATSQAVYALSCYMLQNDVNIDLTNINIDSSMSNPVLGNPLNAIKTLINGKSLAKSIITLVILITCIASSAILAIRKKSIKIIFSIIIASVISLCLLWMINIESKHVHDTAESDVLVSGKDSISISFCIDASSIGLSQVYLEDSLSVKYGASVFDVLYEICRTNDIQIDYEDNPAHGMQYVKSINSIYEFDYGDLSGWMYRVNGEFPSVGCGSYVLSDGDNVEWLYTTELGRDLQ